jgi:hypothetical protein
MFNISSFLEKFSKNISTQESQLKMICDVLFKQTGIVLDSKSIKIQNGILYLDVSPAIKNKIFICKKNILEELANTTTKILDIR